MKSIPLPVAELKTALAGLSKIIPRQNTLPVLGHVKVERRENGVLTLAGNNLDQAATMSLVATDVGESGAILVPLKDFTEVAKRCGRNDTILVESDEDASDPVGILKYQVGASIAEHRFSFMPAAEFPLIPRIEGDPLSLPGALCRSLLEAFQCASDDPTRYILNGAYLDVSKPDCHQVVGTNGRILYASNSFALDLPGSIVIPSNRFLAWKPFQDDGEWSLRLAEKKDEFAPAFQISSLRWRYVSKQIDGDYPNYRQVIPPDSECKTRVALDAATLDQTIRMIDRLPCHDPVNQTIVLQLHHGSAFLLGKSVGTERWVSVELPGAKVTGKAIAIGFNRHYFAQALRFGLTTIDLADPISPGRFREGGRQMIVMPIRVDLEPDPVAQIYTAGQEAPASKTNDPLDESSTASAAIPAGAPTNERNTTMPNPPTAVPATTAANGSSNGPAEHPAALTTALERIEVIKGNHREALRGLNELADLLKQAAREQKASEKEISSVRQTLRQIQAVRI